MTIPAVGTLPLTIPHVVLVDHPGSGFTGNLTAIAAALQKQVQQHFAPFWGVSATVSAGTAPGPNDWVIGMFKDADQPGALGYHDETPNGLPLAKIFPLLDAQDGANVSTTISHELLEMLGDPYLTRAAQGPDGRFWAYEACDAVEQDEYEIDGIKVSDFVTPHYFEPPKVLTGVRLDFLGLVKKPFEVRPGGYMQWNRGTGWHQIFHQEQAPRAYRCREATRSGRRKLAPQA